MGQKILFLIAGSLISGTALMISMSQQATENDIKISAYQEEVLLDQIAKSAESMIIAQVKRDFDNAPTNIDISHKALKGGTFSASAVATGSDELEVMILAEYAGLEREIETTLQRTAGSGSIDAALMLDAPFANITLTGQQFCIVGRDYNPPSIGGNSPRLDVGGVMATSRLVRDQMRTAMNSSRMGNIFGVNGNGDIYHGNFGIDINQAYSDAVANATVTHDGNNISGTFGSAATPVIMHITGNAVTQGGFYGYGVLVIDGNLDTSQGKIYWEGLVIINKESDMSIEFGQGSRVYGAVIVMDGAKAFNMPGNGTLDIMYYQSNSPMNSSLSIHPNGQSIAEVFTSGSNSSSDQTTSWGTSFEMGQQINFFTTTTPPAGAAFQRMARANNPLFVAQPHAKIRELSSESWEITWETGADISQEDADANGVEKANWDFYDEKAVITFVTDNTVPAGVNVAGWESSFTWDTPMSSGSSTVDINFHGTGTILFSSEAIARVESMLPALSQEAEIIIADRYVRNPNLP